MTGLDSTILVSLYLIQHKQSSSIQTCQTGGQPYIDTFPYEVSECSLDTASMLRYSVGPSDCRQKTTVPSCTKVSSSVTIFGNLLDLGQLLKPLATINLPQSPPFFGNFCKGVKIYHFSSETIFGHFYRHLVIFIWSHWSQVYNLYYI